MFSLSFQPFCRIKLIGWFVDTQNTNTGYGAHSGGGGEEKIMHIASADQFESILKNAGNKVVVVDFFATYVTCFCLLAFVCCVFGCLCCVICSFLLFWVLLFLFDFVFALSMHEYVVAFVAVLCCFRYFALCHYVVFLVFVPRNCSPCVVSLFVIPSVSVSDPNAWFPKLLLCPLSVFCWLYSVMFCLLLFWVLFVRWLFVCLYTKRQKNFCRVWCLSVISWSSTLFVTVILSCFADVGGVVRAKQ